MSRTEFHALFGALLPPILALAAGSVHAAGGAHIVDDSEVETPGVCHLETWVPRFVPGDGQPLSNAETREAALKPMKLDDPMGPLTDQSISTDAAKYAVSPEWSLATKAATAAYREEGVKSVA